MSASRRTASGGRSLPAKAPASLRHCKAYLRRRLAHDPPALRQVGCANTGTTSSSPSSERSSTRREGGDGDASGKGASPWEGWWPVGLRTQCEELRKVLRRTVFDGESQSALLLGDTGSGKSLVLDRVLRSLAQETADRGSPGSGSGSGSASALGMGSVSGSQSGLGEKRKRQEGGGGGGVEGKGGGGRSTVSPPCSEGVTDTEKAATTMRTTTAPPPSFRLVYLNGLEQTDDAVAMKEVAQQLGVMGTQGAVYSSNLQMAVETMKAGAVTEVPVVFVLDGFELFASRKTQTLLYALLDLCQDKSIRVAVVGLSTNLNVLDVAEKRVKSRFSFCQVRLPCQDFDNIVAILSAALTVPEGKGEGGGGGGGGGEKTLPGDETTASPPPPPPPPPPGVTASFAREFNAITRQTLGGKSDGSNGYGGGYARAGVKSARADLKALAASGRSVGWFLRLAATAVALLGDGERGVTRGALTRAGEMMAPDAHGQALRSLTVIQALVLVAMVRLEQRGRRKDGCAFQTVHREYETYRRKFPNCPLRFSRAVMFKAFGQLVEQGVARAAESGTGGGREAHPLLHSRFRSRFDYDEVCEALNKEVVRAPTNVVQWCKKPE